MPSIYQLGDVAVLPSMWDEPAGMTMVEAVVSGLPLITTNSGGIPEYIPNDLAILLDRDDSLIRNISESILEIKKCKLVSSCDCNGYKEFVKNVSLKKYYNQFVDIFEKG